MGQTQAVAAPDGCHPVVVEALLQVPFGAVGGPFVVGMAGSLVLMHNPGYHLQAGTAGVAVVAVGLHIVGAVPGSDSPWDMHMTASFLAVVAGRPYPAAGALHHPVAAGASWPAAAVEEPYPAAAGSYLEGAAVASYPEAAAAASYPAVAAGLAVEASYFAASVGASLPAVGAACKRSADFVALLA